MASNNHFTEKKMTYDDINFSRCEAYSEFRDLCIKGVVSELDKFVQKHNYDVNTVDYDLCTLKVDKRLQRKSGLFCASLNANHEACQYLLDKGADINYADEFGRTAFHAALANKDIVNYPYEAYEDRAPEAWHADKRYFRDTIGTLQKYDYYYYSKDITEWKRTIDDEDWLKTVKLFMNRTDCHRTVLCGTQHPISFAAIPNMPFEIARTVMEYHEFNGQGDAMGKGHLARGLIYNNQVGKFRYCLETGILAKDQALGTDGASMLGLIVHELRLDLLKVFLRFRDVDVMKLGYYGEWAKANSVSYLVSWADTKEVGPLSRIEFFKYLLSDKRVKVNIEDVTNRGELPIHRAAIMNNSSFLEALLQHKDIKVNAVHKDTLWCKTALTKAIEHGKVENVRLICQHKDLTIHHQVDKARKDALYIALNGKCPKVVKYLLEAGANPNMVWKHPFPTTPTLQNMKFLKNLREDTYVSEADREKYTEQSFRIARMLQDAGAVMTGHDNGSHLEPNDDCEKVRKIMRTPPSLGNRCKSQIFKMLREKSEKSKLGKKSKRMSFLEARKKFETMATETAMLPRIVIKELFVINEK